MTRLRAAPLALALAGLPFSHARAEAPIEVRAEPAALPTYEPDEPIVPLGPEWEDDASMPAAAEAVHRTKLTAKLDVQTHAVLGTEEIIWTNVSRAPVSRLFFHAYMNAFKNENSVFLRSRLGRGRGERKPTAYGHLDVTQLTVDGVDVRSRLAASSPDDPDDETDLALDLPAPVPPGGSIRIELAFLTQLPSIVERTGYHGTFHMVAQWFPKIARLRKDGSFEHFPFHRLSEFSADFGSYDVTIDVPKGYVVGATGKRVSHVETGDRSVSRHLQTDVHDFAFTAWDGFEVHDTVIDGIAVRHLAPRGHEIPRQRQLAGARVGLRCYGERYGRYPYDVLTIVQPPSDADEAGGMEYPTLITTGGPWMGPPGVRFPEMLTVHEFGHQHFYGLVASDEHAFPFLDEGLNSYAEAVCMEDAYGAASMAHVFGLDLSSAAMQREGALRVGHDDAVARPASAFATGRHYGRLVYSRTAALLLTLRGAYGPGVVDRALARYTRAYRFRHPDPRHLLAAFEDVGGHDVAEALRVGLYEKGWVDYTASDLWSLPRTEVKGVFDRNGKRETVTTAKGLDGFESEVLLGRRGTLALPVVVELRFADGGRRRFVWDAKEPWMKHRIVSASELESAVIDPDHLLLLDERFDNNAVAKRTRGFSGRAFDAFTYWGALLALLSP